MCIRDSFYPVQANKYFSRAISSHATFGKGPHDAGFTCDIVMHVTHGLVLKSSNKGQEAPGALDGAADKIEKQLRRYTRRLKDRQSPGANGANGYEFDNAGYTLFAESTAEEVEDAPLIVAETRVDVPDASVGDAVMMLDLRNTHCLLYTSPSPRD